MEESKMNITKWKRSLWKGYVLYDSDYVTFWKGKTVETIQGSVVARGRREGEMNRQRTEQTFCENIL